MNQNKSVLIVAGTYLPGNNGGGHIQSIASLVEHLGDDFNFYILCLDRDAQSTTQYPEIKLHTWIGVGKAKVMYLPPGGFTRSTYVSVLTETKPSAVYLNTVFSIREVILPILIVFLLRFKANIIVAPRGCLDPGALNLKHAKKLAFLTALKFTGIPKIITWQASTTLEKTNILNIFSRAKVQIAQNLPPINQELNSRTNASKTPGHVKFLFLSRICPKKNLLFFLDKLKNTNGDIEISVAGPIEDGQYWEKCLNTLRNIDLIKLNYIGSIPHDEVISTMKQYHFFVLPTLGENFGHAIIEALNAGLPIIISDQTPWRNLTELGVGWDIPLDSPDEWNTIISQCIDMDQPQYFTMSEKCKQATSILWDLDSIIQANKQLLSSKRTRKLCQPD